MSFKIVLIPFHLCNTDLRGKLINEATNVTRRNW